MAEETGIQWTRHTWSPWWGCTKVSPGCANCYAEGLSVRWRHARYLKDVPRTPMSDQHWRQPLTWDRKARKAGEKNPIFPSMCDPFDAEVDIKWFVRFLGLISRTPNLIWQLLTKRPELVNVRLAEAASLLAPLAQGWLEGKPPENVHLGVSVENQEYAQRRIPLLCVLPAVLRFLSIEPILGPVSLTDIAIDGDHLDCLRGELCSGESGCLLEDHPFQPVDWVIVGGESGEGGATRECEIAYVRGVVWQCQVAASVPVFVKQLGSKPTNGYDLADPLRQVISLELIDSKGGNPKEWPTDLDVRQLPGAYHGRALAEEA